MGFQLRLLGRRIRAGDVRVLNLASESGISDSSEDSSPSSDDPDERLFMEKERSDSPRAYTKGDVDGFEKQDYRCRDQVGVGAIFNLDNEVEKTRSNHRVG